MRFSLLEPGTPTLRVWLEENGSNVDIVVRDSTGEDWFLGSLVGATGELQLYAGIPDNIGLSVDKNGKVNLAK